MKRPLALGLLLVATLVLAGPAAPGLGRARRIKFELSRPVLAQPAGSYALRGTAVSAGGGTVAGSAYSLANSIGRPEPGPTQSGGGYSLNGGLVDAGSSGVPVTLGRQVYLPHVVR